MEKKRVFGRIKRHQATELRTFAENHDDGEMKSAIIRGNSRIHVGRLISDTKEIVLTPDHARFSSPTAA